MLWAHVQQHLLRLNAFRLVCKLAMNVDLLICSHMFPLGMNVVATLIFLGESSASFLCRIQDKLDIQVFIAADTQTLFEDLFAQLEQAFDQLFRTRWTTRYIDVDGDDGIDALDGIVAIVEFPSRIGALAHTELPLWLGHLLPQVAQT